jgi:amino acid permease
MPIGGFGLHGQRRNLFNKISLSSNDSSSPVLNNSVTYPPPELLRYKTASIFVCIPSSGYERFFRTYIPIFDILLVAAIPFLLLCFTNIGIIIFTMRNNRHMRQQRKRSNRRHQRLTIMLLSVTLAFIGLTCPSVIFICVNKITLTDRKENSGQASHVQQIVEVCEALWYTKHAMNFILYTLSGQDFRREFTKVFTECCTSQPFLIRLFKQCCGCQSSGNKTPTTTLTNPSAIDTQLPLLNAHNKILDEKQIKKTSI